MASQTAVTQNRHKAKQRKAGRKRKNALAKNGTTKSQKKMFGD
jgi:hypothetical protein